MKIFTRLRTRKTGHVTGHKAGISTRFLFFDLTHPACIIGHYRFTVSIFTWANVDTANFVDLVMGHPNPSLRAVGSDGARAYFLILNQY